MACALPAEQGVPLSRWSATELAREAVARGIVEQISGVTVWRWLSQDGEIRVTTDGETTAMTFSTLAFANQAPRTLTLYGPHHERLGTASLLWPALHSIHSKTPSGTTGFDVAGS